MDYIGLSSMKNAYIEELTAGGEIDRAAEVLDSKITDPIFAGYTVHPEAEPDITAIDEALRDIAIDIYAARNELSNAATSYSTLMQSVNSVLNGADEVLTMEEDRIKDMNIVCGNYPEFTMVKTLKQDDFAGTFSISRNDISTFTCPTAASENADLTVLAVSGNGYEGNAYVKNGADSYLSESVYASERNNMIDGSAYTYYEYSRLTATEEKEYPSDVNFDKEEASCSITLLGSTPFSAIKINSAQDNLKIIDVLTSSDNGASFQSHMSRSLAINNRDDKYTNSEYIYNSGILAFPATQIVRIVLQSGGTTSEKLAYTKVDTSDENNPKDQMIELENTKRHAIRINEIEAISDTYSSTAQMRTGELISDPVNSIAIFASEYIPEYYPDEEGYIQYILTVNGVDYEVVPINTWKSGTKIIRFTEHSVMDHYVQKISENIKSAKLTVIMKTPEENSTPYISNLKICLGKAELKP